MSHPYHHAVSSARRFGGKPEDYQKLHDWFDATKEQLADFRHRALRHHTQGIFEAERVFGVTITNSEGRQIPTRLIGEQHVMEDCGRIPTPAEWLRNIPGERWMLRPTPRKETSDAGQPMAATTLSTTISGDASEEIC